MTKFCGNCGSPVKGGQKFCGQCGAEMPEYIISDPPVQNDPIFPTAHKRHSQVNIFCLLLIFCCILLWLFAPLAAINYLSLGDQSTGWYLLSGEDYELDYLKDSTIFKLEVFVLVGVVLCFLIELTGKQMAVRIVSILTVFVQIITVICMFNWLEGDMDYFREAFGLGFWGIAVLLVLVSIFSSSKDAKTSSNPIE